LRGSCAGRERIESGNADRHSAVASLYSPGVSTKGPGPRETLGSGPGWKLARAGESEYRLCVWSCRPVWRRALAIASWAVFLGVIAAVVHVTSPEVEFSLLGVLTGSQISARWPSISWWFGGTEEMTFGPRFISLRVEGAWRRSSETVARPETGDAEVTGREHPRWIALPGPTIWFRGGGRTLAFGRELPRSEAQAIVALLDEHSLLAHAGRTPPGVPGSPLPVSNLFVKEDGRYAPPGVNSTRPRRVGVSGLQLTCSIVGGLALFIGGLMCLAGVATSQIPGTAAIVGALLMAWYAPVGLGVRWRHARYRRLKAQRPETPSLWTGDFDRDTDERTMLDRLVRSPDLYGVVGSAAFAFFRPSGVFAGYWVLAALISIICGIRVWNLLFAGDSEVRWEDVPTQPGDTLSARFSTSRSGAHFESIAFHLRHYEERPGKTLDSVHDVVCTHEAAYVLPDDVPAPGAGEAVVAHFDLPEDVPVTDLLASVPSWWELEVSGKTSCGQYSEHFRAPVFAAPERVDDGGPPTATRRQSPSARRASTPASG